MKQIAISRRWRESGVGYKIAERCDVDTRVCLQTLAGREQRIHGEIVSRIYSGPVNDDGCQERRANSVRRHSKPIQFADNSGLLSGNYFRGLGKRVSRLLPSLPPRRKDGEHALVRDRSRRAHTHTRTRTRRMYTRRWRSRSPVRGRDRSSPSAGSVPEIISFAAKRTRTIPWHRSLNFESLSPRTRLRYFHFHDTHAIWFHGLLRFSSAEKRWNTRLSTPPDWPSVADLSVFTVDSWITLETYDYVFIRSNIYIYLRFY